MLTSELLRVKRQGGLVLPRYLRGATHRRLVPAAAELIAQVQARLGATRDEIEDALSQVDHAPGDRVIVLGLRKLLLDRCDFTAPEGVEPQELREAVFLRAAAERRTLSATDVFDRARVLAAVAAELGIDAADVEARLFADLRKNERLSSFRPIDAEALLHRYDVALAQGVLLRATRVEIALEREEPGRVRELFRAARFRGLLHRVRQLDDERWRIELDGPMSLFHAGQKYGLQLALFLPSLLQCTRWQLRAELLWGKRKEPASFELDPGSGLRVPPRAPVGVAQELSRFVSRFEALASSWRVRHNDEIIALPGEVVCVPDLVFDNVETGEEVFLEAFGFWSRTAVWQRVETLSRGFPSRIILAVSRNLRVSEELLDADAPGEIYVYGQAMQPRAVLERLDAVPDRSAT